MIVFVLLSSPFCIKKGYIFAETTEIETELNENINEQINNLDTSELDKILQEIVNDNALIEGSSFSEKIKDIISGKLTIDASSFLSYVATLFVDDIVAFLPYVCLIIAISVLYSMVSTASSNKKKSLQDIIHFVCYGAIVIIVVVWASKLLTLVSSSLQSIKTQMDLLFPILLTILTALGGSVSASVYQPAMAMLSGTAISIFTSILMPIFTFMLVFIIISNLTTNIKFNKFADFFGSAFKWIMGIVLTLFSAFVSIQGLMAGSIDTISLRTAKYTIKSAVPIIGGFLSDGVSLIMVSSVLIKNAVGVGGLLILFCTMLMPVLKIIVFSFLMKLASAILEPIADSRVTGFVSAIAKSIQMLVALILGVVFMYFLIIALVMCSTNIF